MGEKQNSVRNFLNANRNNGSPQIFVKNTKYKICKIETVIRAQSKHCAQKSSGANCLSNNYGNNKSVLEVN